MENSTLFPSSPDPLTLQLINKEDEYVPIEDPLSEVETALRNLSIIVYSIAFLLGTTGNGLVIWIAGFRMKRTVNTVWYLNLAIADFIFTLFLPFYIVYTARRYDWPFGTLLCKLNYTVTFLNSYASVLLLTVISADRFVSVVRPVWSKNHRTPRLANILALATWLVAFCLCSPYLAFFDTKQDPKINVTHCYINYAFPYNFDDLEAEALRSMNNQVLISVDIIFGFLLPFGLILVFYSLMVLKLRRNQLSWSSRPFKVMATVVAAFFLCCFPFYILSVLYIILSYNPDNKGLESVLHIGFPLAISLIFFNSCLNPFLYVFLGRDFKESLCRSIPLAFERAFSEEHGKNTDSQGKPRSVSD